MTRLTFFVDIAGRVARSVPGNQYVTAAAVAYLSDSVVENTGQVPVGLPKWRSCTVQGAEDVVSLVSRRAVAIGIYSINKNTEKWDRFWEDEKPLQEAILRQDNRNAGFVKPANVIKSTLIGGAIAVAMGHALAITPDVVVDLHGQRLIERTIVCDQEIEDDENLDVFKSNWAHSDSAHPLLLSMGFRVVTKGVDVTSEQNQPLLLMPDYVAGLFQRVSIGDGGTAQFPMKSSEAERLVELLNRSGRLAVHATDFDLSYADIFGEVIEAAQAFAANRQ